MRVGIGQDSHRFDFENNVKPLVLGGVTVPGEPPLLANSDGDVILHSITNAISGITGVNILGTISDDLCLNQGITDSSVYLEKALQYLNNLKIVHVSISVECKTPKLSPIIHSIKSSIATLLDISVENVGLTATSGEGLTDFGKGLGIQAFSIITAKTL